METPVEFNNATNLEFTDISSEQYREYETMAGTRRIENPLKLNVSENGHRVWDAQGKSHYIDTRFGFFLTWEPKKGQPHFVK